MRTWRCWACGRHYRSLNPPTLECHPAESVMAWPRALAWSRMYLISAHARGTNLDRWIEAVNLADLNGQDGDEVTRDTLRDALAAARRWKESWLQEIPTDRPITLYGRTPA